MAAEKFDQLVKKAVIGDESAFVEICNLMKTKLYRTAKGILGDEASALDAVSETVCRAFKGIKRLRQPEYAETWLIRILLNVSNDFYRKRKNEILMETVPEEKYFDKHSDLVFDQIIESLPSDLRQIISLKYFSDYKLNEISEILKLPEGTVKSRLNRALNLLRLEAVNE